MSADAMQSTINQLSLVMVISEDIVKACKKAGLHPDFVKVMLRMHEQQRQIEKTINELRSQQLDIAKTLLNNVNISAGLFNQITTMNQRLGFDANEGISTDKAGEH